MIRNHYKSIWIQTIFAYDLSHKIFPHVILHYLINILIYKKIIKHFKNLGKSKILPLLLLLSATASEVTPSIRKGHINLEIFMIIFFFLSTSFLSFVFISELKDFKESQVFVKTISQSHKISGTS